MKKALLVGINAYPSAPLQGCVNDVLDYQATLGVKGFSWVSLTDGLATKARIIAELNTLVGSAQPGDSLVFAYSGHGSYITDQNSDEADRKDELLCPVDFPSGYIRDDDLKAIFARLPVGVVCDVFLDSCFSGTCTRLAPQEHRIPVLGARYLPFSGKKPAKKDKAVIVPTMKESLFAASGEHQTSSEISVAGKPRGAFSYYACKFLRTYPTYTRDQLVSYAKAKIAAIGLSQVPQLECQAAKASQIPFS